MNEKPTIDYGDKIVLDMADDPVRRRRLIAVLAEMVAVAMRAKDAKEAARETEGDGVSPEPEDDLGSGG